MRWSHLIADSFAIYVAYCRTKICSNFHLGITFLLWKYVETLETVHEWCLFDPSSTNEYCALFYDVQCWRKMIKFTNSSKICLKNTWRVLIIREYLCFDYSSILPIHWTSASLIRCGYWSNYKIKFVLGSWMLFC